MSVGMEEDNRPIIGVDFDNTIVTYNELLYKVAVQRGLIPSTVEKSKKDIRDQIRLLPDGEIEWQKLQAIAYGPRISEAKLNAGVWEFFELCKCNNVKVYIVSHKTEFAEYDETRTNLCTTALGWLRANQFFQPAGLGLSLEAVFFGATRQEKIKYIGQLGCTHFIDDLEETFLEEGFPADVEKILYAPCYPRVAMSRVKVITSWHEISEYFFAADS